MAYRRRKETYWQKRNIKFIVMCNKEIVICAAIWVQDDKKRPYQPTNIPSGTVFCGLRHPSILSQLAAYGIAHKNCLYNCIIQLSVNPKDPSESFFGVYDRDEMKLIYSIKNSILKGMFGI